MPMMKEFRQKVICQHCGIEFTDSQEQKPKCIILPGLAECGMLSVIYDCESCCGSTAYHIWIDKFSNVTLNKI